MFDFLSSFMDNIAVPFLNDFPPPKVFEETIVPNDLEITPC